MSRALPGRAPLIGVVTIILFAVDPRLVTPLSGQGAAGRYAPQFFAPFAAQIRSTPAPTASSAHVMTVGALAVATQVVVRTSCVDAGEGGCEIVPGIPTPVQDHLVTLTAVDPVAGSVAWEPALAAPVLGDSFVRTAITAAQPSLFAPKNAAADEESRIYVADVLNHRIVVFDAAGRPLRTVGSHGALYELDQDEIPIGFLPGLTYASLLGRFNGPQDVDVVAQSTDPTLKNIVVADTDNHRIQVLVQQPHGACPAGPEYVVATELVPLAAGEFPACYRVSAFGTFASSLDRGDVPRLGQFGWPFGVAVQGNGRIAVIDPGNERVEIFDPVAGGTSGSDIVATTDPAVAYRAFEFSPDDGGSETLNNPLDVDFDPSTGRVVVPDQGNHRVLVFETSGASAMLVETIGGAGNALGSGPGEFSEPSGVAVDGNGRLYVADFRNSRIQIFSRATPASPYVYQAEVGGLFVSPRGVAVDATGRLLVVETGGNRVHVLAPGELTIVSAQVSPSNTSIAVGETVEISVVARNTGEVTLINVVPSVTATLPGSVVGGGFTPAALLPGAEQTFVASFKVTSRGDTPPGEPAHLRFRAFASGVAGAATVVAEEFPFDPAIVVQRTAVSGLGVASASVVGFEPDNDGVVRVPQSGAIQLQIAVENTGATDLTNVVAKVTAGTLAGNTCLVNPALPVTEHVRTSAPVILPHANPQATVDVSFTPAGLGAVMFCVEATGIDDAASSVAAAPATRGVVIVADLTAPRVTLGPVTSATPPQNGWYNSTPTVRVTATDEPGGSGVRRLRWVWGDALPQGGMDVTQTGQTSVVVDVPAFINGTIQGRPVLRVWAEDYAGNVLPPPVCSNPLDAARCLPLNIDTVAPEVPPQRTIDITLSPDNTQAFVQFRVNDDVSQPDPSTVRTALPNTVARPESQTGLYLLTLTGESEFALAKVFARDLAGNESSFDLPYTFQQGRVPVPLLRLDSTPPEAFNRFNPQTRGRTCTATRDGVTLSYACSNQVYGTDNFRAADPTAGAPLGPGQFMLSSTGFAPVNVAPARWGGEDNGEDARFDGTAELHTYTFTDEYVPEGAFRPVQNPSRVTLTEKVRQSGRQARVRVVSFQQHQGSVAGPVIVPDWAYKKYEWSDNTDGSMKSLVQKFEVGRGAKRRQVLARWDAKTDQTAIHETGPSAAPHVIRDGLVLLRMTTKAGALVIEY